MSGRDAWLPLDDEAATMELGARLARTMPVHRSPLVIYLHGDLGAGKTTLARGLLHALGETGPVRSPTYSLLTEYVVANRQVQHLDLYRLESGDELQALGLGDFATDGSVWLIEWPEKARGVGLPRPDIELYLEPAGTARRARIEVRSEPGRLWAAGALGKDSA